MDRVAFVVATGKGTGFEGGQGTLDRDAMSERFALGDAGFEVEVLSLEDDLASQLDDLRTTKSAERPSSVAFYASSRAVLADGTPLLLLDADDPGQGDALGDVLDALADFEPANLLVLLDLRCDVGADTLGILDAVRLLVKGLDVNAELIAAVRPLAIADEIGAESPSPLTRAVLEALDGADPAEGLFAVELYERIRESEHIVGKVPAIAYAGRDDSLALLLVTEDSEPAVEVAGDPSDPPGEVEVDVEDEAPPPRVVAPAIAPPAPSEEAAEDRALPSASPEQASATSVPEAKPAVPPPSVPTPSRPSTPPNSREVAEEAARLMSEGDDEEALARYRKALALVGAGSLRPPAAGEVPRVSPLDAERAGIYVKIAEIKTRQEKAREAIAGFEKAISLDPALEKTLLSPLHALYRDTGDLRALRTLEERMLATAKDDAERARFLVGFGRSWLDDRGDLLRARETLEAAVALAPGDRDALELLHRVAATDGRADDALLLRRRLAETEPDQSRSAEMLFEIAEEYAKQKREDEALDLYEAALDAAPSRVAPLARMSALLAERQEWSELEGVYQRMIERVPQVTDSGLRSELELELQRRLGLLLRDHLEDHEGALRCFERGLVLSPGDVGLRKQAIELSKTLGLVDAYEDHLVRLSALEPHEPAVFHALFELSMKGEDVERACDIAAVLVRLGVQNDRERAVFEANKPGGPLKPATALESSLWAMLRRGTHPGDSDVESVAEVFRAVSSASVGALTDLAKLAKRLPALEEQYRVDPKTSTVSAARSLHWGVGALGLELPAVYLEEASREDMTPVLALVPTTVIGTSALRGRSVAELAFFTGYNLAAHVPEHRLARLSTSVDDLAACFLAAVRVVRPELSVPERLRALVDLLLGTLKRRLDGESRAALEAAVGCFEDAGGRADLIAYARAVERASLRAGLLLANDYALACRLAEEQASSPLKPADRVAELSIFAANGSYAQVRGFIQGE